MYDFPVDQDSTDESDILNIYKYLKKKKVPSFYCISSSFVTKCLLLNDVPCIVRPALIDLNHVELKHYPFAISIDKCTGSCNVLIPKMCVPKETKDIQVRPKIAPFFAFHCKIVFYKSLAINFSWCRQQPWEILSTPIWIQLDAILRSSR